MRTLPSRVLSAAVSREPQWTLAVVLTQPPGTNLSGLVTYYNEGNGPSEV